jgi:hypothetical protein
MKRSAPRDMTGNSRGKPPISHTPRFTHSAILRKCALQGVSSDHVLQIPACGWLGGAAHHRHRRQADVAAGGQRNSAHATPPPI